jgi:hypothetical protein
LELARYVVLNPVRAGVVADGGDWPRSSHRAMLGQELAPAWLQTDWLLGQFDRERSRAQAAYASFVRQGIGQPSVRDALRHQVFLGSEAFVERHRGLSKPLERLREVPRAQRRPLAKSLADFARAYPVRHEAMARAYQTGVYSMQEIANDFGAHDSTVSRAVRRPETGNELEARLPDRTNDACLQDSGNLAMLPFVREARKREALPSNA